MIYLLSVRVLNLDEKSVYIPGYIARHKTLDYPHTSRVFGLKRLVPDLIVQFVTSKSIAVRPSTSNAKLYMKIDLSSVLIKMHVLIFKTKPSILDEQSTAKEETCQFYTCML